MHVAFDNASARGKCWVEHSEEIKSGYTEIKDCSLHHTVFCYTTISSETSPPSCDLIQYLSRFGFGGFFAWVFFWGVCVCFKLGKRPCYRALRSSSIWDFT